jgi:ElaB/YqjD/DUF883 family membrane-anchored ribosome-binding protein
MSTTSWNDLKAHVRAKAEAIAREGADIRNKISKLASDAAERCHREAEGLVSLARAVMEGAAKGVEGALPDKAASVFRQVIDGLADGLATSAHAAKLTLEEARSRGAQFAREDLDKIAHDFRAVGEGFVDAAGETFKAVRSHAASQGQQLREHARETLTRVKPAFESAIRAAAREPVQLGKEALQAGAAATRHAAGTLFSELAKRLEQAAQHLKGEKPD